MSSASPPAPSRAAAAYIRVSTEDQAELSPETQLAEIRKYACRENIALLPGHVYVDAGISGKKAQRRPEFLRMIAAAKGKDCPFQVILVWKFSRFARNQEESIFYKSVLRSKCGVEVCSITEPLAAGPFGSLMERIIEWMDEFYSIRLSQEVKRSMSVNAQRGKLQCPAAYGYRAKGGRLVPVETEARLIRLSFAWFMEGKGCGAIARELNALGARTHRGCPFEGRTVEYILRNPVYAGKLRWNPAGHTRRDFAQEGLIIAEAEHPPLVSPQQWEAVQRSLDALKEQRAPRARPASERKSWLSGLVRCSACGAPLVFTKPHYYRCGSYVRGRCGASQHIRGDLLEEALLSRLTLDAKASLKLRCEPIRSPESGDDVLLCTRDSLRQLEGRRARLQEAYLAGALNLAEFAAARERLEQSASALRQRLTDLDQAPGPSGEAAALPLAAAAAETLWVPEASLEQKSNAARSVIESCSFDKSSSVLSVTYRFTLPC